MFQKILLISLAGALGTLARYALTGIGQKINTPSFPWGTLAVNIIGCFLAGLIWHIFENKLAVSHHTKTIMLVGFMGAFTTFSAFILETSVLYKSSGWIHASSNIALHNIIGFLALFGGFSLAKLF